MTITEDPKFSQIHSEVALFETEEMNKRKILLGIEKFCNEKNCFRKIKPGNRIKDYYTKTIELLHTEIKKEQPVSENVFTVLSNVLLLLNNASNKSLEKFSVIRYDAVTATDYLEESCHIEEKYKRIQNAEKREQAQKEAASTAQRRHIACIQKRALIIIQIILLLVFISGVFLPKQRVAVQEDKPFYTEAYDWIRFNIFGEKEPEAPISVSERYRPYTYMAGAAFALICLIYLFSWTGRKTYQICRQKYRTRIKQDWDDFQLLKCALKAAECQLAEMEE